MRITYNEQQFLPFAVHRLLFTFYDFNDFNEQLINEKLTDCSC